MQRPGGRSTAGVHSQDQPGWDLRNQDGDEGVREGTGGQIVQGLVGAGRTLALILDVKPVAGFGQGNGMI